MSGDQRCREFVSRTIAPMRHHRDGLHTRHFELAQIAQKFILAGGHLGGGLFDGEHGVVERDKPNDVT